MFNFKDIIKKIKNINKFVDEYKKDTVIQSLPTISFVNRAKVFINQNNYPKAEKILLEALELPQKDALVYKYLGLVYERTGKLKLSCENYQISADLNPNDKNIWQRLGFALISTNKYEQAVKSFENANRVQFGNSDTYTGWGMALMKLKDFPKAHEKFMQAMKINKYNFSAVFLCSVMEIKLGMLDKAESKLAFLSNAAPNESNTFEYARLKAIKNDIESAIHYAKKSIDFNPNMMPAYILLGQLFAEKFDKENSIKYFKSAEEKNLITPDLYFEWGKALIRFEDYKSAETILLKAPENINTQVLKALCKTMGNEDIDIQKIKEKVPENKIVQLICGINLYRKNEIDEAIKIFKTDSDNFLNNFYLAKCFEKKNNDSKVKEYYNSALLINEKSVNTYLNFAEYLVLKNEYREAQLKLRHALKYEPENVKLLNLMFYISYILVKENICEYNVKEAISIADKIEKVSPDLFEYPEQKSELERLL